MTLDDLLSQNVLQSSDALARQIPSESSRSFRLLPEPEPESSESRLLCGDLLRARWRGCKYWFLCVKSLLFTTTTGFCSLIEDIIMERLFNINISETEFPKDQKCVRKISHCKVAVSNKHEIAFFRRRNEWQANTLHYICAMKEIHILHYLLT